MGTPEKLFISSKQRPDKEIFYGTCTKVESDDIEYIRTDAFIERAEKWLYDNADMYEAFDQESKTYYMDKEQLIKDFKKAMLWKSKKQ